MSKSYLHNHQAAISEAEDVKIVNNNYKKNPINVDINKLLNRVKIEEKNRKKEKLIFFAIVLVAIGIMGIFIAIVK
jgi:hypothetical protein